MRDKILESLRERKIEESYNKGYIKGTVYGTANRHCSPEPDGSFVCHECVYTIAKKLGESAHSKEEWVKDLEFWMWDERKWKIVGEVLSKDGKPFGNKVIENLLTDIEDGSMNGHSFIQYGRVYFDPYLFSLKVPDAKINSFGNYMAKLYKKVGIRPVSYNNIEAGYKI